MKEIARVKLLALIMPVALGGVLPGCDKQKEAMSPSAPAAQGIVAPEPVTAPEKEKVQLMHVHGLAYSPDGKKILIPSHQGLAVYSDSGWSRAPGPQHDYMGFSATKNALYSSGHPAPGTGMVNPFGVIKSTDGGQTWEKLGFEGESDFHLLATGYESNAIFVVNSQPNSKMKEPGIYSTFNDGFSWQRAQAKGLQGDPESIAVHPSDPKQIAAGTANGLYLSRDAGASFQKLAPDEVVSVFFDLDGKHLWFGSVGEQAGLSRLALDSRQTSKVNLPAMEKDGVAYVAQNPARRDEYAIVTFQRSVYLSRDQGQSWKQIAEKGDAS